MPFSLGLTLYTLGARAPVPPAAVRRARPPGPLVWLHAAGPDALRALFPLVPRLADGHGLTCLVTADHAGPAADADTGDGSRAPFPDGLPAGAVADLPPADHPAAARAFLDHWRPAAALMAGGELRPLVLAEAITRGIPLVMAEARDPVLPRDRGGWFPGLVRGLLSQFRAVHAVDEPAARAFRKAGAVPGRVEASGRMERPSAVLHHNEAEREALSRLLGVRPVWLAAMVPEEEEPLLIEAQRRVLRLAHRLLMIVVPERPERAAPLAARMEEVEGWVVARRFAEEEPDPEVQVLVADTPAEMGLWLRLAPVTFLGGSLTAGGCRFDPMAAAALGSAVIHGARPGAFGQSAGRLAAAQAAALVGSAAGLAEALAELMSADRAARLAEAAWAVSSEGGEVSDRVATDLALLAAAAPDGEERPGGAGGAGPGGGPGRAAGGGGTG